MASFDDPGSEREPQGDLWVDRWIVPALREPSLLPLVLVVVGHLVAFVAPMLVFALRDANLGARAALVGLAVLSFGCVRFEWRARGRPALLSIWVGISWIAALAAAWACYRYSLF